LLQVVNAIIIMVLILVLVPETVGANVLLPVQQLVLITVGINPGVQTVPMLMGARMATPLRRVLKGLVEVAVSAAPALILVTV
jgi:hypothetical protein